MKPYSRRKLARTFLHLLHDHSLKPAARVLAQQLKETHRTKDIDLLIKDIEREHFVNTGNLTVKITSARKLTKQSLNRVEAFLKKQTQATHITFYHELDPTIQGGVILESADWRIDLSIKARLNKLETAHA